MNEPVSRGHTGTDMAYRMRKTVTDWSSFASIYEAQAD
jgi:hypothetical protein